ncbi:hypothetical protein CRG98_006798 [Punica granatum]|uniref:Retroviral polymerase SH3-like domain-containing protein n=1 Tax=Punica granatum TaxID=22663 RepID=A0A2I0KWJ1_PUNGR|nr:hypothetical protein CRG98_006798 [Punica granatum]
MPTSILGNKSPHEVLLGKPPNYDNLRVFGSLCYAHHRNRDEDKFAAQSCRCIFVGYPNGKKRWRLYDLQSMEFFVSRDVRFCENKFPFADSISAKIDSSKGTDPLFLDKEVALGDESQWEESCCRPGPWNGAAIGTSRPAQSSSTLVTTRGSTDARPDSPASPIVLAAPDALASLPSSGPPNSL